MTPLDDPDDLSADDLIAHAARHKLVVGPRDLKRLRSEGVLQSHPHTHPAGVQGSAAKRYPREAAGQLVAVMQSRQGSPGWSWDQIRFELWWEGRWIDPARLRPTIEAVLSVARMPTAPASEAEALEVGINLAAEGRRARRSPVYRAQLQNLTGDQSAMEALLAAEGQMMFGAEPEWSHGEPPSTEEVLRRASGLAGSGSQLEDELTDVLSRYMAAGVNLPAAINRLVTATDEELGWGRTYARAALAAADDTGVDPRLNQALLGRHAMWAALRCLTLGYVLLMREDWTDHEAGRIAENVAKYAAQQQCRRGEPG